MYPNFLCIGAQKAGTSWLYKNLGIHPEIWLPAIKEIHYFDRKFPPFHEINLAQPDRSLREIIAQRLIKTARVSKRIGREMVAGNAKWALQYHFGKRNDNWYKQLFSPAQGRISGDITPNYSTLTEKAIQSIHQLMPDAKIIFLLRNPVERAWSCAKMNLSTYSAKSVETLEDDLVLQFLHGRGNRLRGDYLRTLRIWKSFYPDSQFFVGFYDDIVQQPDKLLLEIFRFLGVDDSNENLPTAMKRRVNAGPSMDIPQVIRQQMSEMYLDDLEELSSLYGGHVKSWLDDARGAIHS